MTGRSRPEYEQRVNRVVDHIRAHLADELSLVALARLAAFSPFHLHRLFRAITGETLFGFIQHCLSPAVGPHDVALDTM